MMRLLLLSGILFFFACNREAVENEDQNHLGALPEEARGRMLSASGLAPIRSIPLDMRKLRKMKAGRPEELPGIFNEIPCENLPFVQSGPPEQRIPGKGGFRVPAKTIIREISVAAGEPEKTLAGNMATKDRNPASFSYFSKLHGIHPQVKCILEDNRNNLWFGTLGGGLIRYDGRNFSHFNEKTGLSKNRIQCLMQDRKGNIWIGTDGNGAIRYDGKKFSGFSEDNAFPGSIVQSICEDRDGNIWFGTDAGAIRYDGNSILQYTEREGLGNNVVNCIITDKKGNLWFGTDGGGVSCFDGKQFTVFSTAQGLGSDYIISMLEGDDGKIWMGTAESGVFCLDGNKIFQLGISQGLSGDKIWSICRDQTGNLWFGTENNGLTRFDGKKCTQLREQEGLSNNEVHDILQDHHGNLWIGTFGGINQYHGNSFSHFTEREGLGNNRVISLLEDHKNNLWFGTWGGGLSCFNGSQFFRYTQEQGLPDNNITSLFEDRNKVLWIGTQGSGIVRFENGFFTFITDAEGLLSNSINCITQDKSGNLWFGTFGGGASRYDGKSITNFTVKEGISSNEVNSILEDNSGNIWFGTSNGLTRFDGIKFTHFSIEHGLSENEVFSLMEDGSGNIWVGTGGAGISVLSKGRFYSISTADGLSNDFVFSLMEDKEGGIWAGTRNGLNWLRNQKSAPLNFPLKHGGQLIRYFAYEDGFLAMGCNLNAMREDRNGTIWVGGNDRLTAVRPKELKEDTIAPRIEISSIDLFNEKIGWSSWTGSRDSIRILKNGMKVSGTGFDSLSCWNLMPENLSMAYNMNNITFYFTGITTNRPRKVKYQYQLQGFEESWSSPTSSAEASYSNLPFGSYVFKVKAMNGEGLWGRETAYSFTIRPPWWRTLWAYAGYMIFVFTGLSGFVKWREKSLKHRQKELEREIGRATTEIRNQNEVIEDERKRSDALLTNILPEKIAEELKVKGTADARFHEAVSVLFTDFSDFTGIAAGMSPDELVKDLHECFSEFDFIVQKHGLEKIKIIGDSYMAASGIPEARPDHAVDSVKAALEIQSYLQERRKKIMEDGGRYYDLRIGIHSGPVVAGVVGARKFQYDIWGDTVNTASRMESSGAPGRINISEETFLLVKDQFDCEYRGELEAKGKGKIRMYFVNGLK